MHVKWIVAFICGGFSVGWSEKIFFLSKICLWGKVCATHYQESLLRPAFALFSKMTTARPCRKEPNRSTFLRAIATPSTRLKRSSRSSRTRLCPKSSRRCSLKPNSASLRRRKKHSLTLNGKRSISIQTLHGDFAFREQKFLCPGGEPTSYLAASGQ